MKIFIAGILLLAAGSADAHNSCGLELDAGLRITDHSIEFYDEDKQIYKIIEDQYLVMEGQTLRLTRLQQEAIESYAASIRATVPEVRGMALEGIDLAIAAITIAFDGLLGDKNQVSTQLTTELNNVKSDLNRYFSSGDSINFNRGKDDSHDFLGKYFETRVERIMETSVQNSIGSIMFAMGKEILASGGNMEAFEARMNKFGEQMEAQMNVRAAGLEVRGKKLCSSVRVIDAIEEQLKRLVPSLQSFNVIRVDASKANLAKQKI